VDRPAWLAEATSWIDEHASRTGEIEQPHIRPWATALRVPTADGDLCFKAMVLAVAHELPVIGAARFTLPRVGSGSLALDKNRVGC